LTATIVSISFLLGCKTTETEVPPHAPEAAEATELQPDAPPEVPVADDATAEDVPPVPVPAEVAPPVPEEAPVEVVEGADAMPPVPGEVTEVEVAPPVPTDAPEVVPPLEPAATETDDAEPVKTPEQIAAEKEVVVSVDGKELTAGELAERVDRLIKARGMENEHPIRLLIIRDEMSKEMKKAFITETILANEVAKRKIVVPEEDVDARLAELKESLPEDIDFAEALVLSGMTEEDLKEDLQKRLSFEKLIDDELGVPEEPTEEEVKAFYDENPDFWSVKESVRARHILVMFDKDDGEAEKTAKLETIKKYRQNIIAGEDFGKLAREVSDDPGSAAKDGDLGFFTRGKMVKPFETAAFSQKEGECGEVVTTQYGYHIIEVITRRDARTIPMDEVEKQIRNGLKEKSRSEPVQEFITSLKDKATVVMAEEEKPAFDPGMPPMPNH